MNSIDLNTMRHSGAILAGVLECLHDWISPGVSPYQISNLAKDKILSYPGAYPAFLGYKGFPEAACISVNEQVVHGIPSHRLLQEGDIVSFDCGVVVDGHYTDACRTIPVGEIDDRLRKLIKTTDESLNKGIEAAFPGKRIGDISYAIQKHVERKGFVVHLYYGGHGIGRKLHMEPFIPNYGPPGQGELLVEGMCLAIEPVVFDGPVDTVVGSDAWTVFSPGKYFSAHFEDTIIITKSGPEIITRIRE